MSRREKGVHRCTRAQHETGPQVAEKASAQARAPVPCTLHHTSCNMGTPERRGKARNINRMH
eukprot:4165308-Alexandrium_andersonii.AAC.1